MRMKIAELRPAQADEDELRQFYEARMVTYAADYPSRQLPTYESWAQLLRTPTSLAGRQRMWAVQVDGRIVAAATVAFPEQENRHLTITEVRVPPLRK